MISKIKYVEKKIRIWNRVFWINLFVGVGGLILEVITGWLTKIGNFADTTSFGFLLFLPIGLYYALGMSGLIIGSVISISKIEDYGKELEILKSYKKGISLKNLQIKSNKSEIDVIKTINKYGGQLRTEEVL